MVVCTGVAYFVNVLVHDIGKDCVNIPDIVEVLPGDIELLLVVLF